MVMFLQNSISYRKLGFELGLVREVSRLCLIKMPKNFETFIFHNFSISINCKILENPRKLLYPVIHEFRSQTNYLSFAL